MFELLREVRQEQQEQRKLLARIVGEVERVSRSKASRLEPAQDRALAAVSDRVDTACFSASAVFRTREKFPALSAALQECRLFDANALGRLLGLAADEGRKVGLRRVRRVGRGNEGVLWQYEVESGDDVTTVVTSSQD